MYKLDITQNEHTLKLSVDMPDTITTKYYNPE